MSAFTEALAAAESDADVLAAVARGINPDGDTPTPAALAEWWPECPEAAKADAVDRLRTLARTCEPEAPGDVIERLRFSIYEGVVIRRDLGGVTVEGPHLLPCLIHEFPSRGYGRGLRGLSQPARAGRGGSGGQKQAFRVRKE